MANYQYIKETGVIIPDTGSILTDVENEYKDTFGQDLVVTLNTPQGVQIAAETEARDAIIRNNAALANQINPNEAGGRFLDAIWALTGGERDENIYSFTVEKLNGVAGTIVPEGIILRANNGNLFISTSTVTIAENGTINVSIRAIDPGPLAAPAGTIVTIVEGVLGLETVTNESDVILGQLEQSDQSGRDERKLTLALQGAQLGLSITSALYKTSGVRSLKYQQNDTNITSVIRNVTMLPHSLYACVDGGSDLAVATSIFSKKGGGCGYNRDAGIGVTVEVYDSASELNYSVSFDRPNLKPVLIRVTVARSTVVSDPETDIRKAILDYAAGLVNGESGFKVGVSVSPFEISGAINYEVPALFIRNVEISLASPIVYSNAVIPIEIYQIATIQESDIQVIIV